jgi:TolB-like protein/Tfp pilus assembly protein PilF
VKNCPKCGKAYADETLNFCLDDGEWLRPPSTDDEPATAILNSAEISSETKTWAQISTTNETVVLPTGTGEIVPIGRGMDKRLLAAPILLGVIILGGFFGFRYFGPAATGQITSIAVLPFENTGGNADSDYLSDGLAESLIYRLSQVPNLKVSPRSVVFRYKGKEIDPEKIGSELSVDTVMSGRMVQRGDSLTISVDLVDTRNNKTLWGEQYERKMSDLLMTQREIASAIADKLQLKLSGTGSKGITKQYTSDNDAYQLYLKGRFYWNKRTGESINKAIDLLRQATEKDANFALAYAALADCYVVSPVYTGQRSTEALPLAKSYAEKSIQIDPTLAEPHTALAMAIWFNDWDKVAAEKEYLRAIELNPNYPTGHHWYSRLLRSLRRSDEAWREIKRAEELDPLSLIFINNLAEQQIERGDVDGAYATCQRMIELDPGFWAVHQTLVWLYVKQKKYPEALAEAQKGVELSGRTNAALAQLGHVYGLLGRRAEALAVIRELEEKFANKTADARDIAVIYTGLGGKDNAFAWLEKAFEYRSFNLPNLNMEVLLDPLHSDPRWNDLLRRVGLPE